MKPEGFITLALTPVQSHRNDLPRLSIVILLHEKFLQFGRLGSGISA